MTLGILFGGQSYEHEISIVSAISLKKVINKKMEFIFCDAKRDFYLISSENMKAKFFSSGEYKKSPKLVLKQGGFYKKNFLSEAKVETDTVLNVIHGCDGEDGKFSALLEFFGIPYIGANIEASVLSYNKALSKMFAKQVGVKFLPCEVITREDRVISTDFPFIVKPLRLGSSIGVSVVEKESELEYALDVAFEFDDTLIIEPYIQNVKEYNLAGCFYNAEFHYSNIEEVKKNHVLDFEQKYLDFARTSKAHKASLSKEQEEAMKEAFNKIYYPHFLGALIRCDFFIVDDMIYLNEINPNPGSMANYLFDDFNEIIGKLSLSLPKFQDIKINYDYIHSINSIKGKA